MKPPVIQKRSNEIINKKKNKTINNKKSEISKVNVKNSKTDIKITPKPIEGKKEQKVDENSNKENIKNDEMKNNQQSNIEDDGTDLDLQESENCGWWSIIKFEE